MVKMINTYTGSVMYVAEDRVQEYIGAGHREVVNFVPAKRPEKKPEKKATTRKRTTRK
jgi:hypothetical protein